MFLAAQNDPELRDVIEKASLVVPESWGIGWASRVLRTPLPRFTPGIDLLTALCRLASEESRSVYLLGSKPGVAEQAGRALAALIPDLQISGTRDGYFTSEEEPIVLESIRQAAPSFLFVGMNIPHQETWIARHLLALKVPVVMGVGGSFDVLSGRLKRAPAWMRRLGVEWIYRTFQEPWRWRRIAQLPVFMWKVLMEKRAASSERRARV